MRAFFLMLFLTTSWAFAGLNHLKIEQLNLDYQKPYGKGDVEKIGIGFSTKAQGPYPVEIHRRENALELNSPFADILWSEPWSFVHDLEGLSVSAANVSAGKDLHTATMGNAQITLKEQGKFKLKQLALECKGSSSASKIQNRLMDDCREWLRLTVKNLDLPLEFFMARIVSEVPHQPPMKPEERPADNLSLTIKEGDFSLMAYTRVVFYAGLRAWGHLSYENEQKTVSIYISQVRFGYFPITSVVMRELRKRIKHPNVTIIGNTIRIALP